ETRLERLELELAQVSHEPIALFGCAERSDGTRGAGRLVAERDEQVRDGIGDSQLAEPARCRRPYLGIDAGQRAPERRGRGRAARRDQRLRGGLANFWAAMEHVGGNRFTRALLPERRRRF